MSKFNSKGSNTKRGRPKAYSYVRFSTAEQAAGNSLARQLEAARKHAAINGWELDEELSFQDRGISAFHGRNASAGALGAFLEAVRAGIVAKGSYLIVESLDRVSRQAPRRAARTIENIVEAGVNLVDLSDNGRVYNAATLDDDQMQFLMMIVRFMRANEESIIKSRRISAAYESKRQLARRGEQERPFTRRLPAWLQWDDHKRGYVVDPHRAKLLRAIFAKAARGWGKQRIARWLNEKGVKTWGEGKKRAQFWRSSYVRKLLSNPSVIGTFVPHRSVKSEAGQRKRKPLQPIENFFPPVISSRTFDCVQSENTTSARGRHAGEAPKSIFAGLLKCPYCSGTVTRVSKGKYVYLVCSRAHSRAGSCKYQPVSYEAVEKAFAVNFRVILRDAPRGQTTTKIESEIALLERNISALSDDIDDAVALAATSKSDAARRHLEKLEIQHFRANEKLRELRLSRESLAPQNVRRNLSEIVRTLSQKPLNIEQTNRALRRAVQTIVLRPEEGTFDIRWKHSETITKDIPFYSRHAGYRTFGVTTDGEKTRIAK
jgi:DNA invertase Pin-like site-specific DNA recombinase